MINKRMNIIALALLASGVATIWPLLGLAAGSAPDMDHSSMDHGHMNHVDETQKNHKQAENNTVSNASDAVHAHEDSASADARDPHAYSGGYSFGPMPRHKMSDEAYMGALIVNRLENAQSRDDSFNSYDLQGWFGKDYDRLAVKAEGEVDHGKLLDSRTDILWSHAVAAYWDTLLGIGLDSGSAPDQAWLAFGVQGLTPYWFEVDATGYVGDQGRTSLRLGAAYELLFTQKLILQPRVETNFYGKQDDVRETGSGLSDLVAGVRLRYEIRREFAPYVGLEWSGKFGGTADFADAAGERTEDTRAIAGVRFWF